MNDITAAAFHDELEKISGSAYGNPRRAAYNKSLNETAKERAELKEVPWYRPFKKSWLKGALKKKQDAISSKALPEAQRSWRTHRELLKADKMPDKATDRYTEKDIVTAKLKKLTDRRKDFATQAEYNKAYFALRKKEKSLPGKTRG